MGDGRAAGGLIDATFGPGGRMETAVGGQAEETIELPAVHGAAIAARVESALTEAAFVEPAGTVSSLPPPKLSAWYPPL